MNTYKIRIVDVHKYENEIEANNEEEAREAFYSELKRNNETADSFLDDLIAVDEICPYCGVELENKMIDVDGTNLEEHSVCPKCGYGTPALN